MGSDRFQNIDLAVLNSRSVKIFAITHVENDPGDRLIPFVFLHVLQMRPGRFYIPDDHRLQLRVPKRRVKDRDLHPPAQIADPGSLFLVQVHTELIVDSPKGIHIIRVVSQFDDIGDIHHRAVREESHLRIPDPVRDSLPFQKIDQRNGALIIPVQYRGLLRAAVGHFQKILVLRLSALEIDFSDARPPGALRII